MSRKIENLGTKILYEVPSACALLFAGTAAYMSEGDPPVREQLDNTKQQLRHWSKLYAWGAAKMPILIAAGAISAAAAYHQSKEKMWLVGGGILMSIVPYTILVMKKTNSNLNRILKESGDEPELKEPEKSTVIGSFGKWVNMHRGRVALALASSAVFFVAKQYTKGA